MGKEIITFSNIGIENQKFHSRKNPILIYHVNIDRIVISTKFPLGKKGFKYFIGYKDDNEEVIRSCILFPKMSAYRRNFDETKYMPFLIKDNELLEKCNGIWDKVSSVIKKRFYSEPVYNEKHLKAKIEFYDRKINTNFHKDNMPKEGSHCICLSAVLIDFVFNMDKSYYPQVFLEESRCINK